jgi:ribosome biogenesis GTPase
MKTARVIEEHKTNYVIFDSESQDDTELIATLRGSFFEEDTPPQFPKVGDFVMYSEASPGKAVIEEIKTRTSKVSRRAVGTGVEQIIVANVDIIFIVMGLDNDFNTNRLERYVLLAKQCEVEPVIILNKRDFVDEYSQYIKKANDVAGLIPVYAVSALSGEGMESILTHIGPKTTAVLLGSSGAGKSTITNWLLRTDAQKVGSVREDDSRGRHTTTSRQLFTLPTGGYLIDTPGMRELSVLGGATKDENTTLAIFKTLSTQCQFTKCDHEKTAGCAILGAIESGDISEKQFQKYKKMQQERIVEEDKYKEELSRQQNQSKKKAHRSYKN